MKRDMELIRKWLLHITGEYTFEKDEYPKDVLATHLAIAIEAGLVIGQVMWDQGRPNVAEVATCQRLTWEGYEFLDASRDPSIWDAAKKKAASLGGAVSFEILKLILKDAAVQVLKAG